jgi:hypothetical protein
MYRGNDFSYNLLTPTAKLKPCENFWTYNNHEIPVLDESMNIPDLSDGGVVWKLSQETIHFLVRSKSLTLLLQLTNNPCAAPLEKKNEWTTSELSEDIAECYKFHVQQWQSLLGTE